MTKIRLQWDYAGKIKGHSYQRKYQRDKVIRLMGESIIYILTKYSWDSYSHSKGIPGSLTFKFHIKMAISKSLFRHYFVTVSTCMFDVKLYKNFPSLWFKENVKAN